jgi:hypothetical protein
MVIARVLIAWFLLLGGGCGSTLTPARASSPASKTLGAPGGRSAPLRGTIFTYQGSTLVGEEVFSGRRRRVRARLLPTMNHVLKQEPERSFPQASYTEPSRPRADGLVDAVYAGIAMP